MSTMVTARIPDELFDQGKALLGEIGVTNTELVRAAYEYVVRTGALPSADEGVADRGRELTTEQRSDLLAKLEAMSLPVSVPEDWDYKEALAESRWAEYEALA